ncbi:prolyl 4-hydroxylase subunit alpha-2-like [Drosophila guanche]|nr:prolyl 4-hydroxylase subunit alpha-2-like [Drosophila guanche]
MILCLILLILASAAAQSQPKRNFHPLRDFLTSKEDRMELLLLDRKLISNLMEYIEELQNKIKVLQRFAEMIRTPLEEAKGREEEYLSNPLHIFRLIRHMHEDWRHVEKFMRRRVGKNQINFIKEKARGFPSKEDADDATEAIYRIILTYDVPPKDLVQGLIDGVQYNGSISAIDCFSIGNLLFQYGEYSAAVAWLSYSFDLVEPEYNTVYEVLKFNSSEVLSLLARCFVQLDREEDARTTLMALPNLAKRSEDLLGLYKRKRHVKVSRDLQPALYEEFNQMCRSSHQNKPSRLHCRYNATTTPFLRLAPLQMEELSLDPYIVVYHNVLSEEEIAKVERDAEPLLEPSEVYDGKSFTSSKKRTALGAWIPEEHYHWPVLNRINIRIHDMTGLKLNRKLPMQMIKYGFGGHYDIHDDYFNDSFPTIKYYGDSMATVLFYLNDARHGGSTVFTSPQLKVPSERGKVLFWYNMRGETHDLDEQTLHGACPVIYGTKTILSRWIHEFDQMFIQPTYRRGNRKFFLHE